MQNIAVIRKLVCFTLCKNAKCCCHEKNLVCFTLCKNAKCCCHKKLVCFAIFKFYLFIMVVSLVQMCFFSRSQSSCVLLVRVISHLCSECRVSSVQGVSPVCVCGGSLVSVCLGWWRLKGQWCFVVSKSVWMCRWAFVEVANARLSLCFCLSLLVAVASMICPPKSWCGMFVLFHFVGCSCGASC